MRDDQTVTIANPRTQNQFVIVGTFVTAPSARGDTTITVDSSVGFAPGNRVQIMLDSGVNFTTRLTSVTGNVLTLRFPLPDSVGSLYGDPIENSVLRMNQTVQAPYFVLDTADGILNVNVLA